MFKKDFSKTLSFAIKDVENYVGSLSSRQKKKYLKYILSTTPSFIIKHPVEVFNIFGGEDIVEMLDTDYKGSALVLIGKVFNQDKRNYLREKNISNMPVILSNTNWFKEKNSYEIQVYFKTTPSNFYKDMEVLIKHINK